jgi:probable HAF family extracellular repeat protein
MHSRLRHILFCVCTFLSLLLTSFPARAQEPAEAPVRYRITDLGTLGGDSEAWGLNSKGQVVGRSVNGGTNTAFVWSAKTGIRPLAGGFGSSWAYDINDAGHATGFTSSGLTNGFIWDGRTMRSIGHGICSNSGFGFSIGRAINKFDALVGESMTSNCWGHAIVRYNDGRGMHDLGTFDPDFVRFNLYNKTSIAFAINDNNQVAGRAQTPEGTYRAFLWQDANGIPDLNRGELLNLGTLGGSQSYGYGLNNDGHVVGQSQNGAGQFHAFLWKPDAGMRDLGTLQPVEGSPGQYLGTSEARAINKSGQVVGYSTVAGGAEHAFLYEPEDDRMYDLNDMIPAGSGWVIQRATAINDEGHVVGWGLNPDGQRRAFLLRPHRRPLIFVPGIAGSELEKDGQNLWFLGVLSNSSQLHIDTPGVIAPDVMRTLTINIPGNPGLPGLVPPTPPFSVDAMQVYEPLLNMLTTTAGYDEYKVARQPARRTLQGCDCDAEGKQAGVRPTLFVFAYDWRLSNDENADKLKDYIACIRKFMEKDPELTPEERKVDILAHSMGGLLSRRYILKNPTDHQVGKVVTLASPFLGAPKLLRVMETGEFFGSPLDWVGNPLDVFLADTLKELIQGFKGAHELAPSRAYYQMTSTFPFIEQDWDYNFNGIPVEPYGSFDQQVNMLDLRHPSAPRGAPGTNGAIFHDHAGQDDWGNDSSGVRYHHIIARQLRQHTIGTSVARHAWECSPALDPPFFVNCGYRDWIDALATSGDGTVPHLSSSRYGPDDDTFFGDLNARVNGVSIHNNPKRYFTFQSTGDDSQAEHSGMVNNPTVQDKIREFLEAEDEEEDAAGGSPSGSMSALSAGPAGVTAESAAADPKAAAEPSAAEAPAPVMSNYLTVRGTGYVAVYDAQGNSNTRIEGTPFALKVPNVTYNLLGADAVMVAMPAGQTFHLTFRGAADRPLYVELVRGVNNTNPEKVVRYRDLAVPAGAAVLLKITPEGAEDLRYDGDGDGTFETVVQPTAVLDGAPASDSAPPAVEFSAASTPAGTQITLAAADSGSGVRGLFYSLDGTRFLPYEGPFTVDPRQTPVVYAFADDHAGNRSGGAGFDVPATNTRAAPTLRVTGGVFTYDGQPHAPTGIATGANGEDLGPLTFTYNGASEPPVGAGTYSVVASFAGNDRYAPASDETATIVINKATPVVNVGAAAAIYDGRPHAATGAVTGVGGADLGQPAFTYDGSADAPVNAGTYAVIASFAGGDNYEPASQTASMVIERATPTVSVTGGVYTYDGRPHAATGAVTGVGGADLGAPTLAYAGSAEAPVNAGSYPVAGSFGGSANYAPASNETAVVTINKAAATITLSGLAHTYDGSPKSATAVTDPSGLGGLAVTYNGSDAAPTNAGSYAVAASLSNQNYEAAPASGTLEIGKAQTSLSELSSPLLIYGATSTALGGKVSSGALVPMGTVSITVNTPMPTALSAVIQGDGTFSAAFATDAVPPSNQPYVITYTYAGSANFSGASGGGTLTFVYGINALFDQTKAHRSRSTIPIKLQVQDANGRNLSSPGLTVTALGVTKASDNATGELVDAGEHDADDNFRFDPTLGVTGGYIYNLRTGGLTTGTYLLVFRIGADPTSHAVQFQIR